MFPTGTVGGRIARTANPCFAQLVPRLAAPLRCFRDISGTICVVLDPQSSPAAAMPSRSEDAIRRRCARSASAAIAQIERRSNLPRKIRRHRRAENKCSRVIHQIISSARCRRRQKHPRSPAPCRRYAQSQAPRARIPIPPRCPSLAAPRRLSRALRRSPIPRRSPSPGEAIVSIGATSPSMLNTLSVTITRAPEPPACLRRAFSRKSMSPCGYFTLYAPESRMPSIKLA